MPTIQVRVPEGLLHTMDIEAARRGVTRSELARQTLATPRPAAGEVTLAETLALLGEQARAGVVAAQTALLRYHLQRRVVDEKVDDPLAWVDEIAARRERS